MAPQSLPGEKNGEGLWRPRPPLPLRARGSENLNGQLGNHLPPGFGPSFALLFKLQSRRVLRSDGTVTQLQTSPGAQLGAFSTQAFTLIWPLLGADRPDILTR
jgi:hypothetical protein